MTSITSDPELLALLVFWAVVVAALVLSTTASEIRRPQDDRIAEPAPLTEDPPNVLPLHHPQVWPAGTHRHHHNERRRPTKSGEAKLRAV